MMIHIRANHQVNERELHVFMKTYGEDVVDLLYSSRLTCAYVAMYELKIIGVLIAWTSPVHPFCTYFEIVLHPSYDRLEAEKGLLERAIQHRSVKLPLQTVISETSRLTSFYETTGFLKTCKTYMPVLDICDIDIGEISSEQYHVQTLDAYVKTQRTDQLIEMVKKHYEETHRTNKVADLALTTWEKLVCAYDVIMDGSLLYVDEKNGEIVAYSFLHSSENENLVELGWCGSKDKGVMDLIVQLVARQIKFTQERGVQYMEGEFDTTNPYAMHVYKKTPFPPSNPWITYQFINKV